MGIRWILRSQEVTLLDLSTNGLIFVTGKGGTGKTAVSVGLARALARRGRRVLLLELDAQRPSLPSYFGREVGYDPRPMATRIDGANLDFYNCLGSYVESVVPVRRVVRMVLSNKVVRLFLTATPGARELVLLSRLWELSLEDRWDNIVVDLPASGHTVALFHCPEATRQVFHRGPLRQRADDIAARFSDPERVGLVFCALPEEMPINETIETRQRIVEMGLPPVRGVLLNRFPESPFHEGDQQLLGHVHDQVLAGVLDPGGRVATAVREARDVQRMQSQAEVGRRRLEEAFDGSVDVLPLLAGTHTQVADSLSFLLAEGLR